MSRLLHTRVKLDEAKAFTQEHHRHSDPLKRHMFTIGATTGEPFGLQGIVTIDRASSAWSKHDFIVEIRRLVVKEDALPNTASFLLGKAKQACFAMGYDLIVTYTKGYESGASLKAAGFWCDKLQGTSYTCGRLETLMRWGCVRDEQVEDVHRQQTDRLLLQSKEFIDEHNGWLAEVDGHPH